MCGKCLWKFSKSLGQGFMGAISKTCSTEAEISKFGENQLKTYGKNPRKELNPVQGSMRAVSIPLGTPNARSQPISIKNVLKISKFLWMGYYFIRRLCLNFDHFSQFFD